MQLFTSQQFLLQSSDSAPISREAKFQDQLGTNFLAFRENAVGEACTEKENSIDNFFGKPGRYNFLYGNPKHGIANPAAAGTNSENKKNS